MFHLIFLSLTIIFFATDWHLLFMPHLMILSLTKIFSLIRTWGLYKRTSRVEQPGVYFLLQWCVSPSMVRVGRLSTGLLRPRELYLQRGCVTQWSGLYQWGWGQDHEGMEGRKVCTDHRPSCPVCLGRVCSSMQWRYCFSSKVRTHACLFVLLLLMKDIHVYAKQCKQFFQFTRFLTLICNSSVKDLIFYRCIF